MARYHLAKRFGNVPADSVGRNPMAVFGDYCGDYGLAKRFGNVAHGSGRAPFVVKPRGLCNSDGSLITGEYYLAKRVGNIDGTPAVVPVCNRCASSGSGSGGSGGTCQYPTCCNWCCDNPDTTPATLIGSATSACGSFTETMARTQCTPGDINTTFQCDTTGLPTPAGSQIMYWNGSTTSVGAGSCTACGDTIPAPWMTHHHEMQVQAIGQPFNDCEPPISGSGSGTDAECLFIVSGSFRNATTLYRFCSKLTVMNCNPFYAIANLNIVCYDSGTAGLRCSYADTDCNNCTGPLLIEVSESV